MSTNPHFEPSAATRLATGPAVEKNSSAAGSEGLGALGGRILLRVPDLTGDQPQQKQEQAAAAAQDVHWTWNAAPKVTLTLLFAAVVGTIAIVFRESDSALPTVGTQGKTNGTVAKENAAVTAPGQPSSAPKGYPAWMSESPVARRAETEGSGAIAPPSMELPSALSGLEPPAPPSALDEAFEPQPAAEVPPAAGTEPTGPTPAQDSANFSPAEPLGLQTTSGSQNRAPANVGAQVSGNPGSATQSVSRRLPVLVAKVGPTAGANVYPAKQFSQTVTPQARVASQLSPSSARGSNEIK